MPIWTLSWIPLRTGRWRRFGNGSSRAMCRCGLIALDFPRNYGAGYYRSVTYPLARTEDCGGDEPPHPECLSWLSRMMADAFFQYVVCRFGMPSVFHSDQGREFENKVMQELCVPCGAHKTRTTPYHPESDGLVERFNITLLMILAMFAGENKDDWDDLLPAVMMAYRSSVHESTGLSLYRLMFGRNVHCRWILHCHDRIRSLRMRLLAHLRFRFGTRWRWRLTRSVDIRAWQFSDILYYTISGRFDTCLLLVTGLCAITPQRRSANWTRCGWARLWWCPSSAGR